MGASGRDDRALPVPDHNPHAMDVAGRALDKAIARAELAEDKVRKLEAQVDQLKEQVADLQMEIQEMNERD